MHGVAMQKVGGAVERIDDPGWALSRYAARLPFVAFFGHDHMIRMGLPDDGGAGLLGVQIRR